MTLYIDRLNGVWAYELSDDPHQATHVWRLVAKTDHFDHRDFIIGSYQNGESVKFLGPFKQIATGKQFVFLPEYNTGDKVWVNEEWFESDASARVIDWAGSPGRIGGVVDKTYAIGSAIIVNVPINVPVNKITKR